MNPAMTYFCPVCWKEMPAETTVCPSCGADLLTFSSQPMEDKLLAALNHPVPENRRLAIQVLGETKSERAVPALKAMLESEEDIYVLIDALKALAAIRTSQSLGLIQKAASHRFGPVRHLAAKLLNSVTTTNTH